uniref:Uncharacterized protein n=1 Tax=Heterorhabditis bacteriophora TaxID=37862 RepID=A0A1I7WJW2_HETBA
MAIPYKGDVFTTAEPQFSNNVQFYNLFFIIHKTVSFLSCITLNNLDFYMTYFAYFDIIHCKSNIVEIKLQSTFLSLKYCFVFSIYATLYLERYGSLMAGIYLGLPCKIGNSMISLLLVKHYFHLKRSSRICLIYNKSAKSGINCEEVLLEILDKLMEKRNEVAEYMEEVDRVYEDPVEKKNDQEPERANLLCWLPRILWRRK